MKGIFKGALLAGVLVTGLAGTTLIATQPAEAIVLPAQRVQFAPGADAVRDLDGNTDA
ncbi:hypothetical protein [Leptolyngbya sp. FACHB-261]|uniref:hypothetical protein n=1 Tax=Leptolyngbya sp. FACHB-261 TaxID=2692806 RepID=UPI00168977A4|nr:hypothetical protein [Leptolyngbya sp. FACHB-261]MBD2101108.1 hypothetical protein [Leptolyngbya sp. FACHB-261]